jgi:hypothetical protein
MKEKREGTVSGHEEWTPVGREREREREKSERRRRVVDTVNPTKKTTSVKGTANHSAKAVKVEMVYNDLVGGTHPIETLCGFSALDGPLIRDNGEWDALDISEYGMTDEAFNLVEEFFRHEELASLAKKKV